MLFVRPDVFVGAFRGGVRGWFCFRSVIGQREIAAFFLFSTVSPSMRRVDGRTSVGEPKL